MNKKVIKNESAMAKIVKKAVTAGYKFMNLRSTKRDWYVYKEEILHDPAFWTFISKSLGWDNQRAMMQVFPNPTLEQITVDGGPRWKYEMHRFLDWKIQDKDTDKFFAQFLKK